ncbi:MAG: glycosyltransferase [Quinella sp. 1Q7]|nr:glycosyltransferase [Quinella sp. 1Q7]
MGRIDVIISAHRAHQTLPRTLASIAAQNILSEISVVVVDDACPEGNYNDAISPFKSRMSRALTPTTLSQVLTRWQFCDAA